MIVPNKVIPVEDSALGRLPIILDEGPNAQDVATLYHRVSSGFESVDQFLLALDVLYVLGKVDVDFEKKVLWYVA